MTSQLADMNPRKNPALFKPGENMNGLGGKVKGQVGGARRLLRDAVLLAAELEGDISLREDFSLRANGTAKGVKIADARRMYEEATEGAKERGGLVGYLRWLAREHPKSFTTLLAKVMPFQITVGDSGGVKKYETLDEIEADINTRQLPIMRLVPVLMDMLEKTPAERREPSVIDGEAHSVQGTSDEGADRGADG